MKTQINIQNGSCKARSAYSITAQILIFSALVLAAMAFILPVNAQEAQYTKPSLWIGAAVGANFNYYQGTTQQLNMDLTVPAAFRHGKGTGLYLAPLIEFHRPETRFGVMLQVGYDSRKGSFNDILTPCDCPAELSTELAYITVEPSLRFAPFRSNFYLFGGPRLALNLNKSFTYQQRTNPAYPEQQEAPAEKGDFDNMHKMLISMQIGAGYDIPVSEQYRKTQVVISPFISLHPGLGQSPRSTETWTLTTLRAGAAIKFGRGSKVEAAKAVIPDAEVEFTVHSPKNIPIERRVRETFPLRNYVFFNIGSTEIPDRYVLLKKDQVKDFKEDQLEVFAPKQLTGRSARGMVVYYNILNILGDRMGKNPDATITLVGSSEKGPEDAKILAQTIKEYLIDVFGIQASRIATQGRDKPKIPSEQVDAKLELKLLREGDRRVSIESASPALLMEFQSGPDAPLKPVEFTAVQVAPLDSYVSFNVAGAKEAFTSWSLEITDEKGKAQYFGPYTQEHVSIPGKSILGARAKGDFTVAMVGQTKSGKTVRKETSVTMVLWTPDKNEQGMRFSVIFEFNKSTAIAIYEKYLSEIVTPKIPRDGTVIIHGHTDIIGEAENNFELSLERAHAVKRIIEKSLASTGRTDVTFQVYGFGENESLSPFENRYPEERFYNRTVVIDIIPYK
jgi:outer membrane protein OmpA-like peptidoglycan-associated protein